jgi:hypothetical protein
LGSERSRETYRYLLARQSGGNVWSEAEFSDDEWREWLLSNEIISTDIIDGIPHIMISQFFGPGMPRGIVLGDMITEFFHEHKNAPHIIIDVQGNGGGETTVWLNIVRLLITEPTPEYQMLHIAKSGSFNRYMWGADVPCEDIGNLYIFGDESWQTLFPEVNPDLVTNADIFFTNTVESVHPDESSIGFNGKLWLLVDEWGFSATDMLAAFSKNTGFATVVGSATSGGGTGITTPAWFALPHSGIVVAYEWCMGFNDDGTSNALRGPLPDIQSREGETALETALRAIREFDNN